jgi:putative hydrolase of the HAD superfamily
MLKTLIFDMGKVIIPFDFKRGYDRMAPLCSYAPEQIPERLRTCDLVYRFESGEVDPRTFVKELCAILELNCSFEEFSEIWGSVFIPETLIPEDMLASLRQRYRLLLLSNTNALHFPLVLDSYPIIGQFHDHILSYKVGAMKPSPKIYQAAIEAAQCAPQECFFTDDIPAYVDAARQHGIDAVQFQSCEQIRRELRDRGVEW